MVCLCVDSRSFSVVPEWDNLSQGSVHKLVPVLAGRCILRDKRLADVRWEWALQVLYLRRPRRIRDVQVDQLAVPDSVTFPVE